MDLNPGNVLLIEVPFHQTAGVKVRPALVILDTGDDDFVAAPITSRSHNSEYDVRLTAWQAAGLNVPSIVRLHKLAVPAKSGVRHVVGRVAAADREAVLAALCRACCPNSR